MTVWFHEKLITHVDEEQRFQQSRKLLRRALPASHVVHHARTSAGYIACARRMYSDAGAVVHIFDWRERSSCKT